GGGGGWGWADSSDACETRVSLVLQKGNFFYSSGRRHTSSDRDWSSDVCSSDLVSRCENGQTVLASRDRVGRDASPLRESFLVQRSEERRVGNGVDRQLRGGAFAQQGADAGPPLACRAMDSMVGRR